MGGLKCVSRAVLLATLLFFLRDVWMVSAEVWWEGIFRKIPNTLYDTLDKAYNRNPNAAPAPTHQLRLEKIRRFFWGGELLNHTKSHTIKYFPISVLYPRL